MFDTQHSGMPTSDRLSALGWDEQYAATAGDIGNELRPARVTRVDRGLCTVVAADGPERCGMGGDLLDLAGRDAIQAPCVGDWVLLRDWADDRTTIDAVLERRTCLTRASSTTTSQLQALAANMTLLGIVDGLDLDPSVTRIERLATLAWESGAQPLIILTKADVAPDAEDIAEDIVAGAPGVDVVVCSVVDGRGIEEIRSRLGTGTLALVGSSGAGKSTLVNELVGSDVLATKAIRSDGRGRHTSVRRELIQLPGGGCVIDTPGVRGVGMAPSEGGLAATFADVEDLIAQCRFSDCGHDTEPGCAIREALDSNALSERRWTSWQKLQREMAWMARRTDARLRADELRTWKHRSREAKQRRRHE